MTITCSPADTRRAGLVAGLHALADFLAAHPDLPVFEAGATKCIFDATDATDGLAQLAEVAERAGTVVTDISDRAPTGRTTHFYARRRFGPVTYEAAYVTRAEMADYHALNSYSDNIRADQEATA